MVDERARSVETRIRRRNIARRLFDEDAIVKVGRFTILERLGMGAMGAVYRAYDPALDRAVALKVLHPDVMSVAAEAAETMQREAQALARLCHPHVVTVHEVGGQEHQVWIAMELVGGGNLDEWLSAVESGGRFDAVIDSMLQAGEGLLAAHGAGVVHRDFKPANVLVGTDGRVRVADFGLARRVDARASGGADADTRASVGTPAYMAPEQWTEQVDARADQYAYCVVFWEALFGTRPDGAELRSPAGAEARAAGLVAVLRRGLREDPAQRYPSMHEVLEAVRDVVFERPRRRRRRLGVLGILGVVLGAAWVGTWMTTDSSADPCTGAQPRLEALWPADAREQRLAVLAEPAPYARQAMPRVREATDAFSRDWADAHRTTCLAHARGEQSDYVFDRRMSCLDRAGASFAAVAERASAADIDVSALVRAAASLPRPQACTTLEALPEASRPPEHLQAEVDQIDTLLARARTYLDAGAPLDALALVDEAISRARQVSYDPVTARALHERGRLRALAGPLSELSTEQALTDLRTSSELALQDRDYALAVEAWSRRAWLDGTHGRDPAPLLEEAEIMIAMVRGAAPSSAEEALLYNNLGGLHLARPDRERARGLFQRSVDVSMSLPYPPRELDNASINLALVTDDNGTRDALFERIIHEQRALLGREHPQVLQIELLQAVTTASSSVKDQTLQRLVDDYRAYHPELAKPRFETHQELAWSRLGRRARDDAALHFEAAAPLNDWDPLARDVARGFASLARGDTSEARTIFEQVARATTTSAWQRGSIAHAQLGLAMADADFERFRSAAGLFAELEHLPTAAMTTRLEVACDALAPHAPEGSGLAGLQAAIERWRSGVGSRADIVSALRAA